MYQAAITGTGVFTPQQTITNAELVEAFNAYADLYNAENAEAIEAGTLEAKAHSSEEFIVKASGIEQRYVMDKSGVLDPNVMHPLDDSILTSEGRCQRYLYIVFDLCSLRCFVLCVCTKWETSVHRNARAATG